MNGATQARPGFAYLSSARRLSVSLVTAALAVGALAHFGFGARGLISVAFVVVLCLLAVIDLEWRVIPNRIVLPAAGAILVAQVAFFPGSAGEWVVGGVGAALVLFLPTLFNAEAIGMGDVKLGLLLGVGLGLDVARALLFGSLAAVPAALWILATRGVGARKDTMPLGPFLALGGLIALFIAELPA